MKNCNFKLIFNTNLIPDHIQQVNPMKYTMGSFVCNWFQIFS